MLVREGMSDVVLTVGPSHTLREAAEQMAAKGIGAALVSDDETPVPCIVTERDILLSLGAGEDPDAERVGDHMSDGVIAAEPGLEPGAGRGRDVAARDPPPGRLRRLRAGRRALDARHRPRLDQRGRYLRHVA